ncbi:hypothetical protein E8E13_009058 [Curvularia kusanoi]|uniref:Rhodanese domain-containing protein n=1 Tax=Curvularia kusanoi TaxID=90978 RepID=A0A9P4TCJ5_CURKU|nr:hypothetical protein E8E13_009058 [Curvularia kusanoi]
MSSITLADLEYISRETLAQKFSSSSNPSSSNNNGAETTLPSDTAVVDVRDSDHIGGHIRGSTWVPSSTLDFKTPELVRELKGKKVVVFHCALSQQRGPSAALRYLREKERLEGAAGVVSKGEVKEEGVGKGEVGEKIADGEKQRVYVLKGGFTEWQEKYGEDAKLTEGYQKDIWEFGS